MKNMNEHRKAEQPENDGRSLPSNSLDHEIDSMLKRYSAEPRAGLEERVLANLQIERERIPARGWWQWTTVAVLATLLLAASIIFWRSTQGRRDHSARTSQTMQDDAGNRIPAMASQGANGVPILESTSEKKKPAAHFSRHPAALSAGPKLDQFPSPQPLSEQEKILESYVANYPEHAALIAQAREDALRRDMAEEMKDAAAAKDSQQ